ncbi:MAG TPA: hypothetical protein PLK99_03945, partial [Burkholderiales bacterium]|nr:hypothetical protein [Burkholderiales bacterium]
DSVGEVLTIDEIVDPECLCSYPGYFEGVVKIAGDTALIHDLDAFLFPKEVMQLDAALGSV